VKSYANIFLVNCEILLPQRNFLYFVGTMKQGAHGTSPYLNDYKNILVLCYWFPGCLLLCH